jgi:LysR family glycine cleavage system transcriptional activator
MAREPSRSASLRLGRRTEDGASSPKGRVRETKTSVSNGVGGDEARAGRRRSLPLHGVRAFDAAARLGSFKSAALELGVTPAAISQQVKLLESHLGTPLFIRLHRELRLTSVGDRLAAAAGRAFAMIEDTLGDLAEDGLIDGAATLTVTVAPSFASKWLAARIYRFQIAHPSIELRIRAEGALSDPAADRHIDVALRYGPGPYAGTLSATQLWPSGTIAAVCSPELAAHLSCIENLLSHTLLRTAAPDGVSDAEPASWLTWLGAAGISKGRARAALARAPLLGTSQVALEVAASGRGVALAPMILVERDLKVGSLIEPFGIRVPDPFSYWLLFRRDRADETRIRAFVRWITQEAARG